MAFPASLATDAARSIDSLLCRIAMQFLLHLHLPVRLPSLFVPLKEGPETIQIAEKSARLMGLSIQSITVSETLSFTFLETLFLRI